ncbi:MAG: hypothetical protein QXP36_05455 [Conexivisphaerales archaeon]
MRGQAILIIFLPVLAIAIAFATAFSVSLNSFENTFNYQSNSIEFSYIANSLCSMRYVNSSIFQLFNSYFGEIGESITFNGSIVTLSSQGTNTYLFKKC